MRLYSGTSGTIYIGTRPDYTDRVITYSTLLRVMATGVISIVRTVTGARKRHLTQTGLRKL